MTIKIPQLIVSFLFISVFGFCQSVTQVYKIDGFIKRLNFSKDTTYVVNFWATWCKPCVEELPAFDSLYLENKKNAVKVILVSLDFKEDIEKKVNPFLKKNNIQSTCVLLDEINGNDFVNKISEQWSGAIPATLFKKENKKEFVEKKMKLNALRANLLKINAH